MCLIFPRTFIYGPHFVYARNDGSGNTVCLRLHFWAGLMVGTRLDNLLRQFLFVVNNTEPDGFIFYFYVW